MEWVERINDLDVRAIRTQGIVGGGVSTHIYTAWFPVAAFPGTIRAGSALVTVRIRSANAFLSLQGRVSFERGSMVRRVSGPKALRSFDLDQLPNSRF